jgi:hypothetical protein
MKPKEKKKVKKKSKDQVKEWIPVKKKKSLKRDTVKLQWQEAPVVAAAHVVKSQV